MSQGETSSTEAEWLYLNLRDSELQEEQTRGHSFGVDRVSSFFFFFLFIHLLFLFPNLIQQQFRSKISRLNFSMQRGKVILNPERNLALSQRFPRIQFTYIYI